MGKNVNGEWSKFACLGTHALVACRVVRVSASGVVCVRARAPHTHAVTSRNHMTQSVTTTVDIFAMSPEQDARSARTRSDKMFHL